MPGIATGTAIGNVVSQEDLYLEGAPYIYFQDDRATPLNNPDAQSYYCAYRDWETDRKSTRLNSSHITRSRMPSSA